MVLAKPLDYETKTLLSVFIHAAVRNFTFTSPDQTVSCTVMTLCFQEMDTAEHFSTTSHITIRVEDGDDQYPHFTPCTVLLEEENTRVCTNPTYTANVTEGHQVRHTAAD